MRVLIVKTSSLGDVLHTFPAVTDALKQRPDLEFHWLVEEAFQAVPDWHPGVSMTVPFALRRWRKHWLKSWRSGQIKALRQQLQTADYDLVIDAQGLLKSLWAARMTGSTLAGYDWRSARESLASLGYHLRYSVPKNLHAITRIRHLFAQALEYSIPNSIADYGLSIPAGKRRNSIVFLHSTTWESKHWPETYWIELAKLAAQAGYSVELPWLESNERLRAERIIRHCPQAALLPRMNLTEMKNTLASAAGVVGVDTGLSHITAAVETPAVTLYGPTDPALTGSFGKRQNNLNSHFPCAPCLRKHCQQPGEQNIHPPCFKHLEPPTVWAALQARMEKAA